MPDVATAPRDAREWVTFDSAEEQRTWRFDLSFLESNWRCIFGDGCQGVLTGPAEDLAQGCCSYGAHLVDKADVKNVRRRAALLTAEEWQLKDRAPKDVIAKNDDGELTTALVDDACVFLNRPGFAEGPGCAFHVAAMRRGESYVPWKPEVCWQLPLRREDEVLDDGWVVTTIGQWERRNWGAGGAEFHWWCSEDPAAYSGAERVVDSMAEELIATVGADTYASLLAYINERADRAHKGVALAHPTVRTKPRSKKRKA